MPATIIGILLALFGVSGVFGQLQNALNTIWDVKAKPGGGIVRFIRSRFLSFAMVAGVCFLLLVSLVFESLLKGGSHYHCARRPNPMLSGLMDGLLQRDCSEETARQHRRRSEKLLDDAYADAKALLQQRRDELDLSPVNFWKKRHSMRQRLQN